MAVMQCTRREDLSTVNGMQATQEAQDLSLLLGTWMNTHSAAPGIVKVVLGREDHTFTVRIYGAGQEGPIDWGEAPGKVYADGVGLHQGTSFTSYFDFGFMDVRVQTYLAKGVLVLQSLNQFKDGSGRSNYFAKEFFFRQ